MQAPKNGFFYVVDAATGEFISAEKIAKVTWAERIDSETGRPVENPGIRYQGKQGLFELWPGPQGAHSWLPQAFSPRTGLVYIPIMEMGALIGRPHRASTDFTAGMGVTLIAGCRLAGQSSQLPESLGSGRAEGGVDARASGRLAGRRAGNGRRSGFPGPDRWPARRL